MLFKMEISFFIFALFVLNQPEAFEDEMAAETWALASCLKPLTFLSSRQMISKARICQVELYYKLVKVK